MNEEEIAAMQSALEKATASIERLEATNKKLKEEKTEATRAASDAQTAAELASEEAATKAGDIEALRKSLETKHANELKKITEANEKLSGELSTLKIDVVIADAISKNGVLPQHADLLSTYLKAGAKMENGEALRNGVPIADDLTAYFASDAAKHYIAAPQNSGGGAAGSSGNVNPKWLTPPVTASDLNRWDQYVVSNTAEANAIADAWGRPDLKA